MTRLRKLQCSASASGLNCTLKPAHWSGLIKVPLLIRVPSGHIVSIFHAIVDPQLPFVDVLFPGFLASP